MPVSISGDGVVTGLASLDSPTTVNGLTIPTTGFGKVLQVVQGSTTTSTGTTSASYVDTTLTVTITPSSTGSKILIMTSQSLAYDGAGSTVIDWQIVRDSTSIAEFPRYIFSSGSQASQGTFAASWLDSPATTSATVYKTQFKRSAGSNTIQAQNVSARSVIIAIEVAA